MVGVEEDPLYTAWLTQARTLTALMRARGQSRVGLAALDFALREARTKEYADPPECSDVVNPSNPKPNPRGQQFGNME